MKLKLILIASVFAMASCMTVRAQNINTFRNGDVAINAGLGLGGYHEHDLDAFTPTFNLMGEYGFLDGIIKGKGCISGGLLFGIGGGHDSDWKDVDITRTRFGTRGTLHYQFIPQLDTYGGLALCIDVEKAKVGGYKDKDTTFNPFVFAGVRYMFNGSVGAYSELTWDNFAAFQIGLSFKL